MLCCCLCLVSGRARVQYVGLRGWGPLWVALSVYQGYSTASLVVRLSATYYSGLSCSFGLFVCWFGWSA